MKQPMSLKDLPSYIQSTREDSSSESPVVNMGQIVPRKNVWINRLAFAGVFCLVVGVAAYSALPTNITVVIDSANIQAVSKTIANDGNQVISVEQNDDSTYSIRLTTRKNIKSFLDSLRKNENIRKIELEAN